MPKEMQSELVNVKICVECDTLFTERDRCPRCTSGAWAWLSRWVAPLGPIAAVALLAFILRGFGG
jgi:hypothetical protein